MIVKLKSSITKEQLDSLLNELPNNKLDVRMSNCPNYSILLVLGDTEHIDVDWLKSYSFVDKVIRLDEPYKLCSRKFKNSDTLIRVGNNVIGGNNFTVVAGPCSVESYEQVLEIAKDVKASGANFFRGGIFKPRSSPYSFQGLGLKAIDMLLKVKEETSLPIISEIVSEKYIDYYKDIDVLQVGARNMQNFELLKALGKTKKPILLKRGFSNTIEEWLMSAEYILSEGNEDIILCERGIRTFDSPTRTTLDLSIIPILKDKTHLPILIDPSHSVGIAKYVPHMALSAVTAKADGVMIEVHNNPTCAKCDGVQAILPEEFDKIMRNINRIKNTIEW